MQVQRRARWIGLCAGAILLLSTAALNLPDAWGDTLPPQVFDTMPLPGEELPLEGPVIFFFDQPMDDATLPDAFSVEPAVNGALTWSDDFTTLTFTPAAPLARATEYTFTIGTGATSAAGVPLAEPFTLTLRTIGYLEVAEVLPADGSEAVDTDSVITVIFNRPVVPLVTAEEIADLPQPLVFDPPVTGKGEWLNTSIYLFTPETELNGGTTYTVTVTAGLTDVTGGVLAEDFSWTFTTVRPDVIEIRPGDGAEGIVLDTLITVRFSQAMDQIEAFAARRVAGKV